MLQAFKSILPQVDGTLRESEVVFCKIFKMLIYWRCLISDHELNFSLVLSFVNGIWYILSW